MTSIPQTASSRHGAPAPAVTYLNHEHGWKSWLFTLDHKRIAVMFMIGTFAAFFVGGMFAMLIRTQLLEPGGLIFRHHAEYKYYNMLFTLHGSIMVWLVLIPTIPSVLGNFLVPLMLGAKDLAFPRLNLTSFYLFVLGGILVIMSICMGGVDTGWTFYAPYSLETNTAVTWLLAGVVVLGFSSVATGINFIVTMHKMRPPGMTWFKLPLFLWALYATSLVMIIATPILAMTLMLVIFERVTQIGVFNPAYGGDPILYQHFFWFYSHPAVYIMILPSMGLESDVIAIHSRRNIFSYPMIAMASFGIAIIGFLVWGHHMFIAGQSTIMDTVFSFLTYMVAIPSAIKIFNWLATLYKGSIKLTAPMLYALAFIWMFTIGGLSGLMLAALAVDVQVHDTYFVLAHFHFIMNGGATMGLLAGLHHWWSKIFGKKYNTKLAVFGFILVFIGYNLTFFPMYLLGVQGMPRRYAHYLPVFQPYHVAATIGAYVQLAGFLLILGYLLWSLRYGEQAAANPWGGATLEWKCSSPPPPHNFAVPPPVGEPYVFDNLEYDADIDGYVEKTPVTEPVLV